MRMWKSKIPFSIKGPFWMCSENTHIKHWVSKKNLKDQKKNRVNDAKKISLTSHEKVLNWYRETALCFVNLFTTKTEKSEISINKQKCTHLFIKDRLKKKENKIYSNSGKRKREEIPENNDLELGISKPKPIKRT